MILLISLINILLMLAQTWPAKLNVAMKVPHGISRQLQPIVLLSPVTETQVYNLFKALDINKSSIDIPNKLIKLAAEPLSIPFAQIYNQSIETDIVPDTLKVSQVTPVYKNGDVTDPANYRPISTLSPFSEVLERLIYLTIIPRARVGYEMIDSQRGA